MLNLRDTITANQLGFIVTTGSVGGVISELLGGWNTDLTTLVAFMIIDYILGVVVAAWFKRSEKTPTGALSSKVMIDGLIRKCSILLIVFMMNRLDIMFGIHYICSATVIGFCCSELLSITESLGLMGVPLPPVVIRAIDALRNRVSEDEKKDIKEKDEGDDKDGNSSD